MRETYNLEFKEKISNSFLKTVTAFSNYNDGKIIFGINDKGEYIGIANIKESALAIENKINDSITPQVEYKISIDEEKKIIILNISQGMETPYFYNSKTYKRNDSATIEVDKIELKNLILRGQNTTFDALVQNITDFKFNYLANKFKEILEIKDFNNDILKALELVNIDSKITNAGLLLSDKNNFKIIDIVRFGDNKDIILNRTQIKNISILEAYDKAIQIYRENYQYELIKEAYREKKELIPEKAFREVIANALVHRDWNINSYIQISMEKDFISVLSPGKLPEGLSVNEYLEGQISLMRNPIIGNIFFRLNIIESFGTGIRRIRNAYKNSDKKPIFNISENYIEVKLPIISNIDSLSEDEKEVYSALENKTLASSQIAEITKFGKNKVLNILETLIENGYVVKLGKGRGTKYSTK